MDETKDTSKTSKSLVLPLLSERFSQKASSLIKYNEKSKFFRPYQHNDKNIEETKVL